MIKDYISLESEIKSKYGAIKQQYPNCWCMIDKLIRQKIAKHESVFESAFQRHEKELNSKIVYPTAIYRKILINSKNNTDSVYIDVGYRRKNLGERLNEYFLCNGYQTNYIRTNNKISYIKSLLFDKSVDLRRGVISAFNDGISLENLINLNGLEDAEKKLEKNINEIKLFLLNRKIKYVFLSAEFDPGSMLFIKACNELDIKVTIFAHGYVQDPFLITIMPSSSNILCLWDDLQVSMIKEISKCDSNLLYNFGYPDEVFDASKPRSPTYKCLLIIEHYKIIDEECQKYVIFINELISQLTLCGYKPFIRFHPLDRKRKKYKDMFNCNLSHSGDLLSRVHEFDFTIGTTSSALFEIALTGVDVYQLKEFKKFNFHNTIDTTMPELIDTLRQNGRMNDDNNKKNIIPNLNERIEKLFLKLIDN